MHGAKLTDFRYETTVGKLRMSSIIVIISWYCFISTLRTYWIEYSIPNKKI